MLSDLVWFLIWSSLYLAHRLYANNKISTYNNNFFLTIKGTVSGKVYCFQDISRAWNKNRQYNLTNKYKKENWKKYSIRLIALSQKEMQPNRLWIPFGNIVRHAELEKNKRKGLKDTIRQKKYKFEKNISHAIPQRKTSHCSFISKKGLF